MTELLTLSASFFLIALAAKWIGQVFSRVGLPYITGYLLVGMLAGPFILGLMPPNSTSTLRYIDEISLAVIAFVAGSELYLPEIRNRLKSITWISGGVLVVALTLGGLALFFLTEFLSFAQGMPLLDRVAVAVLGGTILLALSPASTIAVIKEVRAKGPFTSTILGITVTMDVVIILIFAVSVAVASALLTGMGFDLTFVLLLAIDLGLALVAGFGIGKLLTRTLDSQLNKWLKIGLILVVGYAIFVVAWWLISFSYQNFPFEIHIEPLLVAMVAGFYVTNYTRHRDEFAQLLHDVGPAVYVAFFTLTGVAIKLDILLATWPIALALFGTRVLSIFIGSYLGGTLAGESGARNRLWGLGLITQAGIALGLAREVAVEFPSLGDAFATMVISVVVLNEIFGPLLLKGALKRAAETNLPGEAAPDEVRDALILGIEEQSLALARQLKTHGWQVIMVDDDQSHVERLAVEDVDERYVPDFNEETLAPLVNGRTDALVAMLDDDGKNLQACELAYTRFGIPRLIVRLNDLSLANHFTGLGAVVVDQASAMVHLLDQTIRAPQSAALLLHQDPEREIIQVTVNNPEVDGRQVRDIRLPNDVLLLDITRNGHSIVPSGYSTLHLKDEVTLIGCPRSLGEVTLKLGY